jgi:hypothetical protein
MTVVAVVADHAVTVMAPKRVDAKVDGAADVAVVAARTAIMLVKIKAAMRHCLILSPVMMINFTQNR